MPMLAAGGLTPHDITVLLLSLATLLGLAKLLGELARRFRQPAVLGEILAGVLLGPTVLGAISPGTFTWLFPAEGPASIALAGYTVVAVTLLLLVAGLEVDLSTAWKQGRATMFVSLTGLVIPFGLGMGMAYAAPSFFRLDHDAPLLPLALFLGIAMAITALPVIAKILIDLNMIKSALGMLIMSAAMVTDLLGWIAFAYVLALISGGGSAGGVLETIFGTLLFAGIMLTIGRMAVHRVLPFVQARFSWPGGVLGFVLTLTLACASYTEWIGVHAIFGAFIAGVAVGDSPHLHERTRDTIHQFVTNIFAPIFFASIGLRINFVASFDLPLTLVILTVALAAKLGACSLGARLAGLTGRESVAIGFGMAARGTMEIVLGRLALEAGLIGDKLFVAIVIMALATSLIAGPAMRRLLRLNAQRRLVDLLSERAVVINMRARKPREAIAELAERASALTKLSKREIFHAVWRQERLMSSGLENGVAVPRARLELLKKPVVIIGLSEAGIDFDAVDGERARIICMLLSDAEEHAAQIELLTMVARAFHVQAARDAALSAASYTQLLAALTIAGAQQEAAKPQAAHGARSSSAHG